MLMGITNLNNTKFLQHNYNKEKKANINSHLQIPKKICYYNNINNKNQLFYMSHKLELFIICMISLKGSMADS